MSVLPLYPVNFHRTSFVLPWTNENVKIATVGRMKGNKKYLWQMGGNWFKQNGKYVNQFMRGSTERVRGQKWIVLSTIDEKSRKVGFTYTVKTEVLDGKKQPVLFEAIQGTGKVILQFFRNKALADKYGHQQFKDMTYNPNYASFDGVLRL